MANKQGHFNQTTSDGNLMVDHEEHTILEASINSNEKIDFPYRDDHENYNSGDRSEDTETITEYSPDVCSLVAVKSFENSENDTTSYSYHDLSHDIHNTNVTSVGNIDRSKCIAKQPSENRHLPESILEFFSDRSEREVIEVLKQVQDEQEKIWENIDKKYERTESNASLMSHEFGIKFYTYLCKTFRSEQKNIKKAMKLLQRPSFGIAFIDSNSEVLAVQNHYGTWSAPKGHRKIDENGKLEIPWETSWRETFEEISIKLKGENMRELTFNEMLVGFLKMDQIVYLECHLESKPGSNDRTRQIGLFVIPINGNELEFSLKNYKENQTCAWLKMADILYTKPGDERIKCFTLYPSVEYINEHAEYFYF